MARRLLDPFPDIVRIGVFGVRLSTAWLYASVPIMIGKYQHDVPIVAAACVFELMRKGKSNRP